MITALQRDAVAAVEREMRDGRKMLQIDPLIDELAAAHLESSRDEIAERLVQVVRAHGAAVFWSTSISH